MARRDRNGSWRSVLYSINDDTFAQVSISSSAKHPELRGKKIFHNNKEFPLITDDIYLLGFDQLPATDPSPITKEDIVEEIFGPDATSSADFVVPENITDPSQSEVGTPEADLITPPNGQ